MLITLSFYQEDAPLKAATLTVLLHADFCQVRRRETPFGSERIDNFKHISQFLNGEAFGELIHFLTELPKQLHFKLGCLKNPGNWVYTHLS
jgi:hypothetical protein